MKRFLFALGVFAFLVLALSPQTHAAVTCTLETTPDVITTETEDMSFIINTSGLATGKEYYIFFNGFGINSDGSFPVNANSATPFPLGKYKPDAFVITNFVPAYQFRVEANGPSKRLLAKEYSLTVTASNTLINQTNFCRVTFKVNPAKQGNKACTIDFTNTEFKNDKDISIRVATPPNAEKTVVRIKRDGPNGPDAFYACVNNADLTDSAGYTLNNGLDSQNNLQKVRLENGKYYMYLAKTIDGTCSSLGAIKEETACFTSFAVPGGIESQGNPTPTPLPPPCASYDSEGKCTAVKTGLGIEIGTDLDSFIKGVFSVLLGFAGGIAILLIMVSGYRIATSQGDAEVLKNAREQITAAVVGLIFVVFSLVILQIIGVNILNIPGFGK